MIALIQQYALYFAELYLTACVLFLAGKDADSYLLKDKTDNQFSIGRVKRWHADGVALFILDVILLVFWMPAIAGKIVMAGVLIRLSLFDLAFNHWASLPITYLGGTTGSDRFFVRIFGANGAARKSLAFAAILVILNILNAIL